MDLFEQVSKGIIDAMKAKDAVRRDTLRNVKKVFLEAKTAPGSNDELKDADALKILMKLAKQGRESAEIYQQQGRADLAEEEMAQEIIAQVGATSAKEMGKVMGVASKQLAGLADGKAISAKVKQLLS